MAGLLGGRDYMSGLHWGVHSILRSWPTAPSHPPLLHNSYQQR